MEAIPVFDDLLRQVCLGRKIGENPERIRAVAAQEDRALRMTRQSREELQARQLQTHNPELETALVLCSPAVYGKKSLLFIFLFICTRLFYLLHTFFVLACWVMYLFYLQGTFAGLVKLFNHELMQTAAEAENACSTFENQIKAIMNQARGEIPTLDSAVCMYSAHAF